ncbi:sterol 24-C-methyltransferase [Elsinoe australis]|uniref:Sterol 24-C-methyltransferase n=1 Tax=Elsinoe australis TaxID=40998 RepID=A0A2P7Z702_9PEZI|nr:Sterol 24-C-methyltransferase erg-4 [Elsinoe australis]TKX26490.1 sterol 24-C-methyltransferase [Elsinoe australis]
MAPSALEPENKARDADFHRAMHGKSGQGAGGLRALFQKNAEAGALSGQEYFKHFDNQAAKDETPEQREARRNMYASLTREYYNLSTDLYEYGWGQSFHFCRFSHNEAFKQAVARHEHYLAHQMGIQEGMNVLDVGCGVGGPAREICKFTGANIVGLNNNDYQIERATHYAAKEGMSEKVAFVKGDFMQMGFADNTFDAVYAIEATVHAPSLEGIYSEIFRVLKPGGVFGVYEWLMTENYDNDNPRHREIRLGIEQGDGISNMDKISTALKAVKDSGFELLHHEDLAERPDPYPWYWPIAGELKYLGSVWDLPLVIRMTKIGRATVHRLVGGLEMIGLAPKGTQKAADNLALAADSLVAGAKEKLFTPMYLMVARKPNKA